MPKADSAHTTTRRTLLGAAAAAPVAALPIAAAAAAPGSDAELLRLGAEFQRLEELAVALTLPYLELRLADHPAEALAEAREITSAQHALAERMAAIPAVTFAGRQAKARVLLTFTQYSAD